MVPGILDLKGFGKPWMFMIILELNKWGLHDALKQKHAKAHEKAEWKWFTLRASAEARPEAGGQEPKGLMVIPARKSFWSTRLD